MQRDRLSYILLPFAALIAILPLILHGSSCGHDFDFHILNWLEAARQFTHGNLHPHWAYTPAYNAGEPRFIFYPPLSWVIGALLGLALPWTWIPIVYTWLALTASGLALHRLARDFASPTAALLAATFYVVNPYMLFTAYERTAYAELLAAAWIPLLLHAILRKQVTIPRIAIPIALLWLTNAPAAVMSCYALAILTIVRLAKNPGAPYLDSEMLASRASASATAHSSTINASHQTSLQLASNTIAGTLLGLGLAAFYILPAAYERRYVQITMAILPGMRIQDNFLFHHTSDPFHDAVLHTASTIALTLLALTVIAIITITARRAAKPNFPTSDTATRARNPGAPYLDSEMWASRKARPSSFPSAEPYVSAAVPTQHRILTPLIILTIALALLLTPLTAFLWTHLPELPFLQFPWRLLAILAAILSLTTALALSPLKLKPIPTAALAIAIAAALTYPAYAAFRQSCDDEDTVQARVTLFHSNLGTDPTDEYTPTTADNDSLALANPAFWLSPDPNAKAPANATPGLAPTRLALNSPTPQTLILNLRDYPTWRITLNQTLITTRERRRDGLIAIPIPAGFTTVSITYAHPTDQSLGNAISLLSIALLLVTFRRRRPL
jgi:hypothetical protein